MRMTKPFTDKVLWSSIVQSFEMNSNGRNAQNIKPDTELNEIFNEEKDLHNSLEKVVEYLKKEYGLNHVVLDIGEDELFDTFELAEDIFLYFYLKVHELDLIAKKILDKQNKKNS